MCKENSLAVLAKQNFEKRLEPCKVVMKRYGKIILQDVINKENKVMNIDDVEEFLKTRIENYAKRNGYEFRKATENDVLASKDEYVFKCCGTYIGNVFYIYATHRNQIK